MTTTDKQNNVPVCLLTAAGEHYKTGDVVHVSYASGAFAVNGGAVHNVEESETVITIFATTPPDDPQQRDVITYQISPDDWRRCEALRGDKDVPEVPRFRVDHE